ncbi:MAG: family 16 glycosylhydrolase [Clostridia bacterium]|nr:family 16 glycosylhydrolase [Clostridia bacterium]
MKKSVAFMLFFWFVLGGFVGCGSDSQQNESSNQINSVEAVISTDDVVFVDKNGESVYRIVRPKDDVNATALSKQIYARMKSRFGINVRNVSDEEDGTDSYEILIGNCNRPEIETVKKYLAQKTGARYDDYIICTVGKKIAIFSQSEDSLKQAVQYFTDNYFSSTTVSGGIEYISKVEGDFEDVKVNGVPIGNFSVIREHYNASYLTEIEINELIESLYSRTGYRLGFFHDAYKEPMKYEIIVGNADRDGVEKIADYDAYRITVKDSKIYINGGSPHATAMAVSEFGKMLKGELSNGISVVGSYEQALNKYDKTVTLYKKWGDDFDGNEIDADTWRIGDRSMQTPGLNGKIQVRSDNPEDVYVSDGKFYMCAREDDHYYYGGIIQTYKTYKYGYVEMSSIIPHGTGFWTALYMCTEDTQSAIDPSLPQLAGPEYDVMECFGNSEHFAANIHSWPSIGKAVYGWEHNSLDTGYGNEKRYHSPDKGVVLGYDFHTYGMMWDSEKVTFTCDADPYFSYDTTTNLQDIETNNHNVWLRIAMNVGSSTNPEPGITDNPDDWQNTNKFIVDWIHVYQKDDGLSECTLN